MDQTSCDTQSKRRATVKLNEQQRARLSQLVAAKGLAQTARFLGIGSRTVQVAALGGDLAESTLALFEKRFAERDAAGKAP
jgi:hypothetical protein